MIEYTTFQVFDGEADMVDCEEFRLLTKEECLAAAATATAKEIMKPTAKALKRSDEPVLELDKCEQDRLNDMIDKLEDSGLPTATGANYPYSMPAGLDCF